MLHSNILSKGGSFIMLVIVVFHSLFFINLFCIKGGYSDYESGDLEV